jgi:hypothetical protein
VSFATTTFYVSSQQVVIVTVVAAAAAADFVINLVRKLLDTPLYVTGALHPYTV